VCNRKIWMIFQHLLLRQVHSEGDDVQAQRLRRRQHDGAEQPLKARPRILSHSTCPTSGVPRPTERVDVGEYSVGGGSEPTIPHSAAHRQAQPSFGFSTIPAGAICLMKQSARCLPGLLRQPARCGNHAETSLPPKRWRGPVAHPPP